MNPFQRAFSQLQHRQQLLAILIFSLVAIMVWIGVSLLVSQRSSSISPELRAMAEPLTPSLNRNVIQQIEGEQQFTDSELGSFPIFTVEENLEPEPPAEEEELPPPEPSPSPSPTVENPLVEPELPPPASGSAEQ